MTLTMGGVDHHALVNGHEISVSVTVGAVVENIVVVERAGQRLQFAAVNTGTEHVVALVESFDGFDVEAVGRYVRHHSALAPRGANVNFVQQVDRSTLRNRTYERGVEGETLSCGSGAVAAVAVARQLCPLDDGPVKVRNEAQTPMIVGPMGGYADNEIWLTGPAEIVYRGELT